MKAKMKR